MSLLRLQKILSQAGIASRREAEQLILAGDVTVNGQKAHLGQQATWGQDSIKVRGKLLCRPQQLVYFAFYKPKKVIAMLKDPQDRPCLANYLKKIHQKIFPIGRLDFQMEGLLLLTNDGDFAEKIQKNRELLKVYQIKIKGHPDPQEMARWQAPCLKSLEILKNFHQKTLLKAVLQGSRTFDLKQFLENRGCRIEQITRSAIGHLTLAGLQPGTFKALRLSQVQALFTQPELAIRMFLPTSLSKKVSR